MAVSFDFEGDLSDTIEFLIKAYRANYFTNTRNIAEEGLEELVEATPVRTGKTAASWDVSLTQGNKTTEVVYTNTNKAENGQLIIDLLRYGHGNGTGGYTQGHDFVTPITNKICDEMIDDVWEEVTQ